jgi:hypothetical protein
MPSKGHQLEEAVRSIESVILETCPAYNEKAFKIESRKIVSIAGVHHEIDILVEIDLGRGFNSIFIFECKDRKEPTSKNDIIVFSEKIHALHAQRGFFVSRRFTKDARAQAKLDGRIQLLCVREDTSIIPICFIVPVISKAECKVWLHPPKETPLHNYRMIKKRGSTAVLKGKSVNLNRYLKPWLDEAIKELLREVDADSNVDQCLSKRLLKHFQPEELIVNDQQVATIETEIQLRVKLVRPAIISRYEVANRGRIHTFAPVELGDGCELGISITNLKRL